MALITIVFWIAFTFQPLSMNSDGQPVEQFGMDRPLALRAEIVHRLDDADAEEHLPEAIHGDARGQRIAAIHQPPRQAEAVLRPVRARRGENRRQSRGHLFARRIVGAALQQERVARRRTVGHHHHGGNLGVILFAFAPSAPRVHRGPRRISSEARSLVRLPRRDDGGLRTRSSDAVVDTDVLDRAGETQSAARANAQAAFSDADRLQVLVEQNLHRLRPAIDINMDAGRTAPAVVRHEHVLPLPQGDRRDGLHANAEIGKAPVYVQADLAIDQVERVALPSK